jgi:hypothetical protein
MELRIELKSALVLKIIKGIQFSQPNRLGESSL